MINTEYDFTFKVLLIGNSSVGKSSLLLRYADKFFPQTFLPTIGVDFKIRTIEHEGSTVKLQMWDTAGQQKFRTITTAYYKGAQGIILVFDLCDRKTFQDIKDWKAEVQRYSTKNPAIFLVGNKCDLQAQRQVTREEAEVFASSEGMTYFETSAKTNKNVDLIFNKLTQEMKKNFVTPRIETPKQLTNTKLVPVVLPSSKPVKKTTCC